MYRNLLYYAMRDISVVMLICLCSCVDKAYDLDRGTDKTITVGGDLSVPVSSMEEITLKEILNTDEDGDIKADENGDYSLVKTINPSTTEITVNPVNILKEEIMFRAEEIRLETGSLPVGEYDLEVKNCSIEVIISKNDVDDDLVDIEYADILREDSEIRLMLMGTTENLFGVREGFRIVFPEYLEIGTDESFCMVDDGSRNVLVFTEDKPFDGDRLPVKFHIRRIKFGEEYADFNNEENSMSMRGSVSLEGNLYYKGVARESGIGFIPGIFCDRISLEYVRAKVNPLIDFSVNPIDVGELPDILTGDGVMLDATDPRLFLKVSNNSPMDVYVDMEMKSAKGDTESGTVIIEGVRIPGGCEDYGICIHQNREMEIEGMENVYCDNLGEIVKIVPETIYMNRIDARVNPNKYYDIRLGETFFIDRFYEVNIPLMFGRETNIVYNKTLSGWSKDMKDVSFDRIEVYMNICNRIPMNLEFSAMAIDTEGQVMDDVRVSVDGEMEAGYGLVPTEKRMLFVIESADGNTIKGMDGLKLKVRATATDETGDIPLNEGQTIKLEDIRLKMVDGMTVDWN